MRKVWALLLAACMRVATPAMEVTGVTPNEVLVGSRPELRITGSDFTPFGFVSFVAGERSFVNASFQARLGEAALTDVHLLDRQTLTGTAPALPPGSYDLTLIAPGGTQAILPGAFVVTPMVTSTGTGPVDPCVGQLTPSCTLVGWQYRRKIRFEPVATDAVGPLVVMIALDATNIDYAKTTGDDLRFLDGDETTMLPYEIERWDETGRSIVWVNVPEVSPGTEDSIYMVYGKADAPAASNGAATWSDGYDAVWHLSDARESTGRLGTLLLPQPVDSGPEAATGEIAGGYRFAGTGSLYAGAQLPLLQDAEAVTFSAWVNMPSLPTGAYQICAASVSGTAETMSRASVGITNTGALSVDTRTLDTDPAVVVQSTNFVPVDSWHYVTTTQDLTAKTSPTRIQFYIDGLFSHSNIGGATYPSTSFPSSPVGVAALGSQDNGSADSFLGVLDEVRIHRRHRSRDWVRTDAQSVQNTLCVFEAEQTRP